MSLKIFKVLILEFMKIARASIGAILPSWGSASQGYAMQSAYMVLMHPLALNPERSLSAIF